MAVGDIEIRATIYAANGRDRVKLLDVIETEDGGSNFHSLLWERRFGDEWRKHHELSQGDFQWQHPNRRFVSDVHSFNGETGVAALRVGEGNKPMHPLVVGQATTFHYSWRLWDLIGNREAKRLKDCESPFEPCPQIHDES